ncbi:hypothetical protein D3C79_1016290 [compost metagenome]
MRKQRLAQFGEACGVQAVQVEVLDVGTEGSGAGGDANVAVVGCAVVAGMTVDEFAHGGHSCGGGLSQHGSELAQLLPGSLG